jgi:hypothetical protein
MARKFPPMEFGPTDNELADATFVDYAEVGKQLIAWAKGGPATWPKDIDDLRTALKGHLHIPPGVKRLKVIQSDDSKEDNVEFILRLPAKNQVSESEQLATDGSYGKPPVIKILNDEKDAVKGALTKLDLFHARVADYTMRQCR